MEALREDVVLPSTELPAAAQWDSVRPQMSKNLARVDMGLDTEVSLPFLQKPR